MKKNLGKLLSIILLVGLAGPTIAPFFEEVTLQVSATSISEVQNQINETQSNLDALNGIISGLTDEQDIIEEKIEDLNAEIINMMTSIEMKEEEITEKEAELSDKEIQIGQAEAAYEEAKALEEQRYADMVTRIRFMYENGSNDLLVSILQGTGLGDTINRMDYVEKIYQYDREKLDEYIASKNEVQSLWDNLVAEKNLLEEEKNTLIEDRASLEDEKANLDVLLAQKKAESANYEAEINRYKQDAAVAKAQLQLEKARLKELEAAQNQGKTPAATGDYKPTDYTSVIDAATGSDMGKRVAKYACQYIGNPYVPGGTSLTNGADCSGFTFRVYSDFGYKLPRTSYEQRSAGTGVEYSDAQPGDLICYDGHVALYIGGGLIVHASTQKTGIKVSNANYRTILAVRRIV